jgi:hypothetical protein
MKMSDLGIKNTSVVGNGLVGGLGSGGGRDTLLRKIMVGPLDVGSSLNGSGRGKVVLIMALSPLEENCNESERALQFIEQCI